MNVMFGHVLPDDGEVWSEGNQLKSPLLMMPSRWALDGAPALSLVPTFTVAQNIVLGSRPVLDLRLKPLAIRREITALADKFGMPMPPSTPVRDLPVDLQQRVEILKVLYRGASILILDEPTSLLGPRQSRICWASWKICALVGIQSCWSPISWPKSPRWQTESP